MDVLENLKKLPPICAAKMPGTGEPILIKRGEMGYYGRPSTFDVDGYNQRHGVTRYQVDAMLAGSMFGWEVPGADPDYYENHAMKKVVIA